MKYLVTTFTALSLGSISFRVTQSMHWHKWQERIGAWLTAYPRGATLRSFVELTSSDR